MAQAMVATEVDEGKLNVFFLKKTYVYMIHMENLTFFLYF